MSYKRRIRFALLAGLAAVAAASAQTLERTGDYFVMHAGSSVLGGDNPFDLDNTTLTFTPEAQDSYLVVRDPYSYDENKGSSAGLAEWPSPDSFTIVETAFPFPFFGSEYESLYVSASGDITFGAPPSVDYTDEEAEYLRPRFTEQEFMKGPPRIAAFWTLMQPQSGGGVFVDSRSDRVVITWSNMRQLGEFAYTGEFPSSQVTVQATLRNDGRITVSYDVEGPMLRDVIVGITSGMNAGAFTSISEAADAAEDGSAPQLDIVSARIEQSGAFLRFAITTAGPVAIPTAPGDSLAYSWDLDLDGNAETGNDTPVGLGYELVVGVRLEDGAAAGMLFDSLRNGSIEGPPRVPSRATESLVDAAVSGNTITATVRLDLLGASGPFAWAARDSGILEGRTLEGNSPDRYGYTQLGAASPGEGIRRPNFSSAAPFSTVNAAATLEAFKLPSIDRFGLAQQFYLQQPDVFDALIAFPAFWLEYESTGTNQVVRSPAEGIGADVAGGPAQLSGIVVMDTLDRAMLDGSQREYVSGGLHHEFGHNWLFRPRHRDGGVLMTSLTAPDGIHPNPFLHNESASSLTGGRDISPMGGGIWTDRGNGTFERAPASNGGYSYLDLYLMGLISAAEVPEMFVVANPSSSGGNGELVAGQRQTIRMDQIVDALGPRAPSADASPKSFRAAFIALARPGQVLTEEQIRRIEKIRLDWEADFRAATGGRASVSTSLTGLSESAPHAYLMASNVSDTRLSSGDYATVRTGYTRVEAPAEETTPGGLAVIRLRQNGVTVSEVGVLASETLTSARIFADVGGAVDTGVAIANPSGADAEMTLTLRNDIGESVQTKPLTLPAGKQITRFATQIFEGVSTLTGSLHVSSSVPVAVTALRGRTNERNEFLMTTIPVADLSKTGADNQAAFPIVADGGGYRTEIVLMNTTAAPLRGTVQFYTAAGTAWKILDNSTTDRVSYTVPANGVIRFATPADAGTVSTGSAILVADPGHVLPAASAIFGLVQSGVLISEAGVPASRSATQWRTVARIGDTTNTGLALVNTAPEPAVVTLTLREEATGNLVATASQTIPPLAQLVKFVGQLFPDVPPSFTGVLTLSSASPLSTLALRGTTNERGEFLMTTLPVIAGALDGAAPVYFPIVADGGGYTTELVLLRPDLVRKAPGIVSTVDTEGQALAVDWEMP